ncbi:MAG: hypothetical protein H6719_09450 [Sandaracinaceae bacterium]|nr:hypothetical protein [Sandaracinaceae bacterium]
MPRRFIACLIGCASVLGSGCDETPVAPPPPDPDPVRECTEGGGAPSDDAGDGEMDASAGSSAPMGCRSGEVCVQGRCYAECSDDSDCGPLEQCGSNGVCQSGGGPARDGGPPPPMMDAGPMDPCSTVTCEAGQVCHPLSHQCVDCTDEFITMIGADGNCGIGVTPVCDIANGTCHAIDPSQCAACNFDEQCATTDMSFVGACVARDVMGWSEQVCLQSCDDMTPCPGGLTCSSAGYCEPPLGLSCTTWRRARDRAMCLSDDDCNIASTRGESVFFTETCEGEMVPMPDDGGTPDPDGGDLDAGPPDAGPPPVPGRCLQPCGETADCFDSVGGQTCTDTGAGLTFCVP